MKELRGISLVDAKESVEVVRTRQVPGYDRLLGPGPIDPLPFHDGCNAVLHFGGHAHPQDVGLVFQDYVSAPSDENDVVSRGDLRHHLTYALDVGLVLELVTSGNRWLRQVLVLLGEERRDSRAKVRVAAGAP